jgi:hypothetical protein
MDVRVPERPPLLAATEAIRIFLSRLANVVRVNCGECSPVPCEQSLAYLRIPSDGGHPFRVMPAGYSAAWRPPLEGFSDLRVRPG